MDHRTTPLIVGLMLGTLVSLGVYAEQGTYPAPLVACTTPSQTPVIGGRAAYVLDVAAGRALYEKAAMAQLPLASLTKLMTASTALEALGPDGDVLITAEALAPEGESGLVRGERWAAEDLAHFSLIESSNDGAHALALAAEEKLGLPRGGFIDAMNRRARALGMTETYYLDDTGLDVSGVTPGAYGSARDTATLLVALAQSSPALVERSVAPRFTFTSLSGKKHVAQNTTLVASLYPGAIASKTGYTDLAGGNLAFMFEALPGRPVAVVVLGSTREGRVQDVETLAQFATRELKRQASCTHIW